MVAVIKTGHSILRLLNYNEQKVNEGVAVCIGAENYPLDAANLSFHQKFARLQNQAALNENVKRNSIHISLNFDPSEKLSEERLRSIAQEYMDGIGMGDLPYLMYQHFDAGHPHIHLVSVKVRADGSRVETQNIGKNQSEKMRKALELKFGLVKAEESRQRELFRLKPVNAQKIAYGRSETKRAIGNVLSTVLSNYKFTSLPELNAVLKLYNVWADTGSSGSRIREHDGLVYRVLDEQGKPVGVPIKSSDFYNKPGLKFLRQKFGPNEAARQQHRAQLKNTIDLALLQGGIGLDRMIEVLKKEGIDVVVRQNADGVKYGITFVDHRSRCVFNGSDLGKAYSIKALMERCTNGVAGEGKKKTSMAEKVGRGGAYRSDTQTSGMGTEWEQRSVVPGEKLPGLGGLIGTLLEPEYQPQQMDGELKRRRRKKKRQRISPE